MTPLLAENVNIDLSNVSLPLVIASALVSGFWCLQLLAFAFATRPRKVAPGPATMDLGPEPPAVANLVVNQCRWTATAVPATLLDLAARDLVDLEEFGTEQTICRLRRTTPADLSPYEDMVYEHLSSIAVDRVVPAEALTLGPKDKAAGWLKKFGRLVVEDAKRRGLVQARWSRPMWASMRLTAVAAAALIIALAAQAGSFQAGIVVVFAGSAAGDSLLRRIFGEQQLTAAGAEAAARWLGVRRYLDESATFADMPAGAVKLWDRYMSYAAAFGLARTALRSLPMGAEDDHRAWSSYGGTWREVRVRYPRTRLVWGSAPALAMLTGGLIGAAGAGLIWLVLQVRSAAGDVTLSADAAQWTDRAVYAGLAVGALVVAWGARTAYIAASDLFRRVTVDGVVLRQRSFQRGEDKTDYYLAVDAGSTDRIKAWLVQRRIYDQVQEGDRVRATVTPRLGYVSAVETLSRRAAAAAAAGEEPSPAPPSPAFAEPTAGALLSMAAAANAAVPDPATLVTLDDASEALGQRALPATTIVERRTPLGNVRGCRYDSASGDKASLSVIAGAGLAAALIPKAGPKDADAVAGVGDKAFLKGGQIIVTKGDFVLTIVLQGPGAGDAAPALTRLATLALRRLDDTAGSGTAAQPSVGPTGSA